MKRIFSLLLAMLTMVSILSGTDFRKAQAAETSVVNTWTGVEGDLYHYHKSTKGDGVPIIIMPVHFGSQDLQTGGKLQTASKWAADIILNAEFVKDLKDYIDIYVYFESDNINPVPQQGYVDSFSGKYSKAKELTLKRLGSATEKMRIVYLGNSDNAGQVGGHAYGGAGTLLSWGRNPDGSGNWEKNPEYWALHEFWGHTFAGFADEYYMDPYWDSAIHVEAPNMYISTEKPSNDDVPWKNFIGYTDEGKNPHGIFGYEGSNAWRPVDDCYQNSNGNMYVPMYHKWVLYELMMRYAGFYVTLSDFCEYKNITLPNPPEDTRTPEENLRASSLEGGTYKLEDDLTITSQLDVMKDLNLDLNSKKLTINISSGSGIKIFSGKTLTISDGSAGGTLAITHSGEGAGINTLSSTLVINGGTINVKGGSWSAGIGGGTNESNGTVIINGGTVSATGGRQGAGIGGGSSGSSGGTIIVNGGTVTATGDNVAADIGPGAGGGNGVNVKTGGTVTAARGDDYIRPAFVDSIPEPDDPDNPDKPDDPGTSGETVTVPSDTEGASINLSDETIMLPSDFTVAAYSVNGGTKWTKGALPDDAVKFSKLFDKDLILWLADDVDSKGKPTKEATYIKFSKIKARPKANADKLKPFYLTDTWVLAKSSDTKGTPIYEGYEYAGTTDKKNPDSDGWKPMDENGVAMQSGKTKNTYLVRSVASASGSVYTPGSKTFKVTPANYGNATKYKIDYKKEIVKLKKDDLYSTDNGTNWTEVTAAKGIELDAADYITNGTAILVRKGATGKKARTENQTIEPLERQTLSAETLSCANGKVTANMKVYEVYDSAKKKWSNVPKITASGDYKVRLKATVKGTTGEAASKVGTLKLTFGVYDETKNKKGITDAVIVLGTRGGGNE